MADDGRIEVIRKETVYHGYVRVDRYQLRHRLFHGGMSGELTREVGERGHAVAVLPYDPKRDEVVLVEQFRIGPFAHGGEPWQLQIIAGIIDPGEAREDVVRRESLEEADLTLGELIEILSFYVSPSALSEHITVYCARADADGVGGVHGLADEGEDIRVLAMPFADAMTALAEGRIQASPAIIALQWLALNRADLRRRWHDDAGASA